MALLLTKKKEFKTVIIISIIILQKNEYIMNPRSIIIGIAIILLLVLVIVSGWIMSNPPDTILQGEAEALHIKVAS